MGQAAPPRARSRPDRRFSSESTDFFANVRVAIRHQGGRADRPDDAEPLTIREVEDDDRRSHHADR